MKKLSKDWMAGIFLIAVVYMLVKPSSPAAAAITAIGEALTALIGSVTSA